MGNVSLKKKQKQNSNRSNKKDCLPSGSRVANQRPTFHAAAIRAHKHTIFVRQHIFTSMRRGTRANSGKWVTTQR